jgi:hypothetical protein
MTYALFHRYILLVLQVMILHLQEQQYRFLHSYLFQRGLCLGE